MFDYWVYIPTPFDDHYVLKAKMMTSGSVIVRTPQHAPQKSPKCRWKYYMNHLVLQQSWN
jgi:hypothetical protein